MAGPALAFRTVGDLHLGERIGNAGRLPVTDATRLAGLEQSAQLRWMGGERRGGPVRARAESGLAAGFGADDLQAILDLSPS